MTITTYAGLQAAVADWVERGDLSGRLPTFIANFEARVNRWLRDRRMQARDTATMTAATAVLPGDFAEAISVQVRVSAAEPYGRLDPAPSDVLARFGDGAGAQSGRPRFYSVLGGQLVLHPAPDQAYQVQLTYYEKLPALSDSAPSNWLLAEAPDVYLDGALAGFHEFDQNWEAANRYLQKAETGLAELRAADRRVAGTLRVDAALAAPRSFNINTGL